MVDQEENLKERRANCRIWAHMLFWWLVPLGSIISTVKMRSIVPVFIMIGAMSLSVVTNPYPKQGQSSREVFVKSVEHGQKYGLILFLSMLLYLLQ